MKKTLGMLLFVVLLTALLLPVSTSVFAANSWAVGNLVGLCAGTQIHTGSGDNYPTHTVVPENNWTVKVIGGPRTVNGETWWDTSRAAAGDPSGGTGWVKQSQADNCSGNGGGDPGGGGGTVTPPTPTPPEKPDIKPRSDWHAVSPSANDKEQDPNHIVIHHSKIDLDWKKYTLKELQVAFFILRSDFKLQNVINTLNKRGDGQYSTIARTWPGLIWLIQTDHMLSENYKDIGYHYLIAPDGSIYEGRSGGEKIRGQSVGAGNTGIIAINFLGNYDENKPTSESLKNAKKLIDWLVYQYKGNGLEHNGSYVIPPDVDGITSCVMGSEAKCTVPDIAGHYEIAPKVNGQVFSPCPGVNLKTELPYLRSGGSPSENQYPTPIQNSGMLIAMYSPAVTGIVDPLGRHLGFDPATGQMVNEIPSAEFGVESIDDSGDDPFYLYIPQPINGLYSIDVNGTGDGTYHMVIADLGTGVASGFVGETTQGAKDQYQFIYDTEKPGEFESFHDNEAPVTTITVDGKIGLNDWYVTSAQVTLEAVDKPDDGAAGVKVIEYSLDNGVTWQIYEAPFVFGDGIHNVQYRATDRVDNVESAQSITLKVDQVAPVVSTWTDKSEYNRVQPYIVHFSAYDPEPGSGLFSLNAAFNNQVVVNGQVVDLFWYNLGQYTLSAIGEDYAGWVTTNSKSIKLIATIESMQFSVARLCKEDYITNKGICNSLTQKLDSALTAKNRGQNITASNILSAMQNEIKAQTGKAIKVEASKLLLMDSDYVIGVLGSK